jgi:transformation/transcription domain-associated protein
LAARKTAEVQAQAARAAQLQAEAANAVKNAANGDGDVEMKDAKTENGAAAGNGNGTNPASQNGSVPPSAVAPPVIKLPTDMVDEIINQLKTSFPLLALMMEKMVDHISIRAKPNSEEDIYRFFAALLNDAMLVSPIVQVVVGWL